MHPAFTRTAHRPFPLPRGPWIGRQRWTDLLFAHWPVPAAALRSFVPAALEVQEFDGTSWVGLVPFWMEDLMLRGLPALPRLSVSLEMNLRLYVNYEGRPGVWFVSLDASNALAVWGARTFVHLPYFHAAMQIARAGGRVSYRSERLAGGPRVAFRGSYWPTGTVYESSPGSLDYFLTERYCLYTTSRDGRLLRVDIHHHPWPLQRADAHIDVNLVAQPQGIALDGPPALLHFSARQDVVVWPPAVQARQAL